MKSFLLEELEMPAASVVRYDFAINPSSIANFGPGTKKTMTVDVRLDPAAQEGWVIVGGPLVSASPGHYSPADVTWHVAQFDAGSEAITFLVDVRSDDLDLGTNPRFVTVLLGATEHARGYAHLPVEYSSSEANVSAVAFEMQAFVGSPGTPMPSPDGWIFASNLHADLRGTSVVVLGASFGITEAGQVDGPPGRAELTARSPCAPKTTDPVTTQAWRSEYQKRPVGSRTFATAVRALACSEPSAGNLEVVLEYVHTQEMRPVAFPLRDTA